MKKILVWFMVVYIPLFVLDVFLILGKVSADNENLWNWGWILVSIQISYLILSFKIVDPKTKAVVVVLGDPKYAINSGLAIVPFGLAWLEKMPGTVIQIHIPGEPEQIERSNDDKKPLAKGMVWPIRITTGFEEVAIKNFPKATEIIKSDPLKKRMTLEVTGYVRLKINDPVNFLRNIGDVEKLRIQARDTFEATIRVEFGKRTPGLIITHLKTINKAIEKDLRVLFEKPDWGLGVETAQLIEKDLTHQLNIALRDATEVDVRRTQAHASREIVEITAEGNKRKLALEGEGNAAAEKSMLLARAEGLLKMAEVAKTTEGAEMMRLQLLIEALKSSKHTIITNGGVGGLTAELCEIAKKLNSTETTGGAK